VSSLRVSCVFYPRSLPRAALQKTREKFGDPLNPCRENADNRNREEMFMGFSSIHIECPVCHAHYHVGLALFKGAKGIRFRCRKCGNSLDVLHPAGIGPDGNVPNDTSFFREPSGSSDTQPTVSLGGLEQSTSTEMEWMLPPLPKSPPRPRWSSMIVPFLFLLLFVGGYAYLLFTKAGQGMLSGIGRSLADTITFFRS